MIIYFAHPKFTDLQKARSEKIIFDIENSCINHQLVDPFRFTYDFKHYDQIEKCKKMNRQDIRECDLVLADITDKDTGTAWEIGMAEGMGKPVLLFCDREVENVTNVMLSALNFCVRDIPSLVRHLNSLYKGRSE